MKQSYSLAAMKANDGNLNKAKATLARYKHFSHSPKVIFWLKHQTDQKMST